MDLSEIIIDVAKQGPLVGLLLWLLIDNRKRADIQATKIDTLQDELRKKGEEYLNKSYEDKAQTRELLSGLRDAIYGKGGQG